jgi:hypothetical protein
MMKKSNFPNQNIQETHSKRQSLLAVFFGLLTFVVTPLVAIVILLPFLLLGKISDAFNPTIIIANNFELLGLGGFFAAQLIIIGFFALIGDFATAIISWLINHSKKLATITFVSALIFQSVSVAIILTMTIKNPQETMMAGIISEKVYQQFAKIGNVGFEVQDPYSDIEIDNLYPEYGLIYKKLQIIIPVSVSQAGVYQVHVRYSFSNAIKTGSTPMKNTTESFGVGEHIMHVKFLAHEISNYGFWSPASVGGTVDIQLSYLASENELLDKINFDSAIDKKNLDQFLKDEGLKTRVAKNKPTINKRVERKTIQF